jgi:hypothetical protein
VHLSGILTLSKKLGRLPSISDLFNKREEAHPRPGGIETMRPGMLLDLFRSRGWRERA